MPKCNMSPDDRNRLRHIVDAIDAATTFVTGRNRGDLEADRMLAFALVRAIEIIGEAASKLTADGRTDLPGVPWSSIVGMRNRLIHAYFDVDLDILWNTVTAALPPLRAAVAPALIDS